jgi:hypothetical protein
MEVTPFEKVSPLIRIVQDGLIKSLSRFTPKDFYDGTMPYSLVTLSLILSNFGLILQSFCKNNNDNRTIKYTINQ